MTRHARVPARDEAGVQPSPVSRCSSACWPLRVPPPGAAGPSPIPEQVRADSAHYIVVTLRNEPGAGAEHPGSTPRGYDAAGHYGVTSSARMQARALERDFGLREISAWPIATLHVHCIMFQLAGRHHPGHDDRAAGD